MSRRFHGDINSRNHSHCHTIEIMRLKERIVIFLIGICGALCILFVIHAKIVDDQFDYPKPYR